jgi:hypothetical protein
MLFGSTANCFNENEIWWSMNLVEIIRN